MRVMACLQPGESASRSAMKERQALVRLCVYSSKGGTDDEGTIGGIQRWCNCDHHHHHGAGNEGAAWWGPGRFETSAGGISQLRLKFPLCRHLLEQSPSYAACRHYSDRGNALGQSALVVLALVISVCDRLDGGKPLHRSAHRALWCSPAHGRDRILRSPTDDHLRARAGINSQEGSWPRLERQAFTAAVCLSNRRRITFRVDRASDPRGRRVDLADPGSAHQERAATQPLFLID